MTFDLKEGTISMILLAERYDRRSLRQLDLFVLKLMFTGIIYRCICVIERAGVSVYSYMGRLLASPRCSRPETLGRAAVSLGPDALALIDQSDRKSMPSW